jgi:hypothetical protein
VAGFGGGHRGETHRLFPIGERPEAVTPPTAEEFCPLSFWSSLGWWEKAGYPSWPDLRKPLLW